MKKIISGIKNISSKIFFTLGCFALSAIAFADGTDPLQGSKDVITGSVGQHTTIWWVILIIEGFSAVGIYLKTKDVKILGSFLVIMIFTAVFWASIGTGS